MNAASSQPLLAALIASPLRVEPRRCLPLRFAPDPCRACVAVCPRGAIRVDAQITLTDACTGCGRCVPECPGDALELRFGGDAEIAAELSRAGASAPGGEAVFSCPRSPERGGDFEWRLPCLGRVTPGLLVSALAAGFRRVTLAAPPCGGCPSGDAREQFTRQAESARRIAARAGADPGAIRIEFSGDLGGPGARDGGPAGRPGGPSLSRRGFLGRLGTRVRAAARAAAARHPSGPREEKKTSFPPPSPGRGVLLAALDRIAESGSPPRPPAPAATAGRPLFARLSIGDSCDACGQCALFCPARALRASRERGLFRLEFSPRLCNACGLCLRVCGPAAISLAQEEGLPAGDRDAAGAVYRKTISECRACGASFAGAGVCPACLKRGHGSD